MNFPVDQKPPPPPEGLSNEIYNMTCGVGVLKTHSIFLRITWTNNQLV